MIRTDGDHHNGGEMVSHIFFPSNDIHLFHAKILEKQTERDTAKSLAYGMHAESTNPRFCMVYTLNINKTINIFLE